MTFSFHKGCYKVRFAQSDGDVLACQRLRHRCFFGVAGIDQDRFDPLCRHLMVTDESGALVATVRLFAMPSGADVHLSYAAQHYDLKSLSGFAAPLLEIGRFCIAPHVADTDVLRVTWGALTRIVDDSGTELLFGCTSFAGTDPSVYGRAFARLRLKHIGPDRLRPGHGSASVIPFADLPQTGSDPLPPLLRTYLAMGGWVSDHAVRDDQMQTLHVFTCLEVATVPPARARALRALAQDAVLS